MTHSMWLPLLSLYVCRENQAAHQGQLLSALGLVEGQMKSQVSKTTALHVLLLVILIICIIWPCGHGPHPYSQAHLHEGHIIMTPLTKKALP